MKQSLILFVVATLSILSFGAFASPGQAQEVRVRLSQLPAAVKLALSDNCPNCRVLKVTREVENGVSVYDFEFRHGKGEMDVTADGMVVSRETIVRQKAVPSAALEAIRKAAAGGRVIQIQKEEVTAELAEGKATKLDPAKIFYEADLIKGNQVAEVVVTPEGEITEAPTWRKKGAKEN
jgi:uncharacterized membrane protein YkoI